MLGKTEYIVQHMWISSNQKTQQPTTCISRHFWSGLDTGRIEGNLMDIACFDKCCLSLKVCWFCCSSWERAFDNNCVVFLWRCQAMHLSYARCYRYMSNMRASMWSPDWVKTEEGCQPYRWPTACGGCLIYTADVWGCFGMGDQGKAWSPLNPSLKPTTDRARHL